MWWLYLDESGDLGFDFFTKKPSNFFTIAILLVEGQEQNRALLNVTKTTVRRKLRIGAELKGSHTSFAVKQYWFQRVQPIPFQIYALTLNKRRVYNYLHSEKSRLYNYIARQVMDRLPIEQAHTRVHFVVDRCKSKKEIADFNGYLLTQLQGRLDPQVPLDFRHLASHENAGLQAIDLFAWGISRKYEKKDEKWLDVFREKVKCEERYL